MAMQTPIDRKPVVAGKFYPSSATKLEDQLCSLFEKAWQLINYSEAPDSKGLLALVSPHAGYVFSGVVSASAFALLKHVKPRKRVFLVGSSHYVSFDGASIYSAGNYSTPLGTVNVDIELAKELISISKYFTYHPEAHTSEHSLEVQLPFLQHIWGNTYTIVPIVIATQSEDTCKKIAAVLKPYLTDENLFIISTDLSHYPSYSDAVETDKATIEAVLSLNPEKLLEQIKLNENKKIPKLSTSMCGWTSVLTLMNLLNEKKDASIIPILYQNSGDAEPYGEKNRVVGYQSLAAYANKDNFSLNKTEKAELLKLAKDSIKEYLLSGSRIEIDYSKYAPKLSVKYGAFVSLYINQKLRGCIGRMQASTPLAQIVRDMAISASSDDNRFQAIGLADLENLQIEISVLSPMKQISNVSEIVLGKHGIYLKKGYQSGTYLPQVARKTNWTIEEFLGHCSRDKAGIGWDGWKNAAIFTYEALVFRDDN